MSEVHSTPDSNPTRGQSQREAAGFNQNDSPVVSQVQVSIPAPQRGVDRTVSQEAQDTNVNPTGKQPEGTL